MKFVVKKKKNIFFEFHYVTQDIGIPSVLMKHVENKKI